MITGGSTYQDTRKTALLYPGQEGTQSYQLFIFVFFSFLFWTGQEFICLEINYVTLLRFQCMHFLFVLYRNADVLT